MQVLWFYCSVVPGIRLHPVLYFVRDSRFSEGLSYIRITARGSLRQYGERGSQKEIEELHDRGYWLYM